MFRVSKLMSGAIVLFVVLMLYVSLAMLWETRPAREFSASATFAGSYRMPRSSLAVLYVLAFIVFAGGQVIFFLASEPLCVVSGARSQKVI